VQPCLGRDVIYQTREAVFDHISKHRELKIRRVERSIFNEIRDVWLDNRTVSRVFDISSLSNQNLTSKRRSKIVKMYANSETGYPNILHSCDFLYFTLMNY